MYVMIKKIILLLILIFPLFCGCSEIVNQDHEFIIKTKSIIEEVYPINRDNLEYAYQNLEEYQNEIAGYELSTECDVTREYLNISFKWIEIAYENSHSSADYKMIYTNIDYANINLQIVINRIKLIHNE